MVQLERLVISLRNALNEAKPTNHISDERHGSPKLSSLGIEYEEQGDDLPQGPPALSDSFGRISLENPGTSYVGSEHWTALLDEVTNFQSFAVAENDLQ